MNSIDIVREQVRAYDEGKNYAVVTITHSDGSTPRHDGKMIVFEDGTTMGTIGGGAVELLATRDALECIKEGSNRSRSYDLTSPASETGMACGGAISVMIEAFVTRPLLVMIGAGHVGGAVLKLASFVGFDTLLLDDRKDEEIADKILQADRYAKVDDFESYLKNMEFKPDSYVVIATHGHAFDGAALAGVIDKELPYIGMIGSSKKVGALFEKLQQKGIKQEQLDKVYTPIGLDIGGETPEEIALSIMAEILMVKNGRDGQHWTGKTK